MSKEKNPVVPEERILVHVGGEEADAAVSALERSGFRAEICPTLPEFCKKIAAGAGACFLTDDILRDGDVSLLVNAVLDQPPWSDLPLIMACRNGGLPTCMEAFESSKCGGNILLINHPIEAVNLVHAARMALRARRRQYDVRNLLEQRETILGSVQEPFILLDREFRFIYVNDRAAEVRDRDPKELLGKVKWDIFPDLVGTAYHKAVLEAASKNEVRRVEHFDPVIQRWFEKRIYPSRVGLSVIGSDITERREAEEALRRSEERFRMMVESAVEYAIFSMDRDRLITSWNTGAERLLGFSEDEIVGQPEDVIFTAEDREKEVPGRELSKAQVTGQADDERWHVRKDGSRFWASGQVMPMVDQDGEIFGYVKILRDYTGRKRAETWLRALNDTLEKRVEERTAEAEHRANQLQMLAGQLTEAEERERRRLAELLHDHLQQILVAAKMQVGILGHRSLEQSIADGLKRIDGLLERSIEASRSLTVELSPPILYDAGLGPALLWLGRRMFDDHGLGVVVEGHEDPGPESDNLKAFLFQAVRELLFNIVKHAGVQEARVAVTRVGGDVEVTVKDSGVGFDSDHQRTLRTQNGGFGLFSIGERVGLLGGTMNIEAIPGKGTYVCVRVKQRAPDLPTAALDQRALEEQIAAEKPQATQPPEPEIAGRIRILLADDHKILREGLAGLLRDQPDFDVVSEASDGQMAVEMARETEPDVIIMDVSMPRLNGVEATRIITAEMPQVRVIGLSMHAQEDMAGAMRRAGAIGYVTKGAPSEILTAAIRDAALAGRS